MIGSKTPLKGVAKVHVHEDPVVEYAALDGRFLFQLRASPKPWPVL